MFKVQLNIYTSTSNSNLKKKMKNFSDILSKKKKTNFCRKKNLFWWCMKAPRCIYHIIKWTFTIVYWWSNIDIASATRGIFWFTLFSFFLYNNIVLRVCYCCNNVMIAFEDLFVYFFVSFLVCTRRLLFWVFDFPLMLPVSQTNQKKNLNIYVCNFNKLCVVRPWEMSFFFR